VGVKEKTSTAVSADEEKLAAGQKNLWNTAEKLMKARKMREGTWMERKPPWKTPSPHDKGAEGSSAEGKKTSLRLQHTVLRQTATKKTQEN
jgi:hypothetical protein